MKYGFNNFVTNQTLTQLGNVSSTSPGIKAVRVKDIILDENHPLFTEFGEWNGLGTIFFEEVKGGNQPNPTKVPAKPAFPNQKYFPLINEIVYIFNLPTPQSQTAPNDKDFYYLSVVSIWNSQHHNAVPNGLENENQAQDYEQTEAGAVRRVRDGGTEIDLGKTFVEKPNVNPLLPFEGDFIQEGRWGNSIRFGSTVSGKTNWSQVGQNGDPITIIRNGENPNNGDEGWVPVVEDINNDLSSIWMTSTQKVPLQPSTVGTLSKSYPSDPPENINEYSGKQIILNSGRLVFNTNEDHILLSSNLSIGLKAVNGINIDTSGHAIINSPDIRLGSKEATEPLMLGDKTVELLGNVLDELSAVMGQLSSLVSLVPGAPFVPLNAQAVQSQIKLNLYKNQLRTLLSKQNKTV